MKRLPFRLKIALLSASISGLVLVSFSLAGWLLISRQKMESVDTEIRSLGARHPGWIANRGNYQRLDAALEFIFGEGHQSQIILLVKGTDGKVLYTSPGWPKNLDPTQLDCTLQDDPKSVAVGSDNREIAGPGMGRGRGGMGRGFGPGGGGAQVTFTKIPKFQSVTTATGAWRLGMLGTADTTLAIGLNHASLHAELDRIRNGLLLALPAALLLVALGGLLVAGCALRPMRTIAETAEQVTVRGLDRRIPASNEDPEIARVIQVLNRMMDRLEASFRQATRFTADASHELKTPLAIMQGELEQALQGAAPGSKEQETFGALLEETQRLKGITRSLLLLAQADAGQLKLAQEPINVSAILECVLEDAEIMASESGLRFQVELQRHVMLEGDRALLQTALLNLLTNAVKYNEPGGRVQVELVLQGEEARLEVGNTGPGIPAEEHSKIFDRFHRVDAARSRGLDGVGLGLSLAREIVRAHGGELVLKESQAGWTCFAVRLPRRLS
ncbi:MAG: ATP-binding protein [Verrucomicrobia bacterium]|nr:ATP-binding protein [Verrucomicrobiota bacterium]